MKTTRYLCFLMMTALLLVWQGFWRVGADVGPVKIGVITSLTGKTAISGEYARRGALLALEEIERDPRLRDLKIALVFEDDAGTNQGAVNALKKITGEHRLVAIIGPVRSTQIFAMSPTVKEIGLPFLTGATNENITRQGNRWLFRLRTDDSVCSRIMVRFAVEKLAARHIGILHDTDAFGAGGSEGIVRALKQLYGLKPVAIEKYHSGDKDYTAQLLNLKNAGAQVVLAYSTNSEDVGIILRQYRELGLPFKWVGSPSHGTTVMLNIAREAADGTYVVTDFSPENPGVVAKAFRMHYVSKYKQEPDVHGVWVYDGVRLLAETIRRVGADPDAIRKALHDTRHYEGASGELWFDEFGNGEHQELIVELMNGKHRVIDTIKETPEDVQRYQAKTEPTALIPLTSPADTARAPSRWISIVQLLINGLAIGSIYALVAMGIVLTYNAALVVNFAQGEMVMLGGFFAVTFLSLLKLPLALGLLLLLLAMGIFGYLFQRVTYYPLRHRHFLNFVVSTIGASILLKNLAKIVWGAEPLFLSRGIHAQTISVLGVNIVPYNLVILAVTGAALGAQHLLFAKTALGIQLRAVAQDKRTASLMGIKVNRMIAITFILSALLSALAGLLLGPIFFVTTEMSAQVSLKAFCATIVGGFGSIPGAILGGLFLGVAELFSASYISASYKDAVAFVILILVLWLKPTGFLGEKISERV
jgi:branched-chain amino acid transport system permease protein